ncbi:methionine aminopeptidase [Citrobacter braakii]|nr:methionine aminopeptidase [Citrobacter freundii]AVH83736.1 methionine aminopeptidase [Citrobacter braakii]
MRGVDRRLAVLSTDRSDSVRRHKVRTAYKNLQINRGPRLYTRHTSSYRCVGCAHSPQSLTYVSSWGFILLPPSCNSNYLGY